MKNPSPLETRVQAAARLFKALAHPKRIHVLALLLERWSRTVSDLCSSTELEQTAMSHQLKLLRTARLVVAERDGRTQLYRLADRHVAHIVHDALAHVAETE